MLVGMIHDALENHSWFTVGLSDGHTPLTKVSVALHKARHVELSSHDTVELPIDHDWAHMPVAQ